ncbi:MAG: flippase-like domain-containing protein, partial [Flavobacteriales bacterium]|nr:flippase-like domain-containing protein [Flavobacteriales bacterium]
GLFVVHTVFIWLCYFLMVYVCFFAMDATSHLGIGEGFTILTTGSLGILAPVPGGVGTYHTFVAFTLEELYNISADSSVSFAYLVHGTQYIVMAVTGALSLLLITLSYRKNAS